MIAYNVGTSHNQLIKHRSFYFIRQLVKYKHGQ